MATKRRTKKAQLSEYLAEARPERITEAEWRELLTQLAPISESYLRGLLRSSGIPLDPIVEGIRQDSFEELERTLLAMSQEYSKAKEAGRHAWAGLCRRAVILAKDHARLAVRRPTASADAKARKAEMISWMMVWLEDPAVFPAWVKLRKKAASDLTS